MHAHVDHEDSRSIKKILTRHNKAIATPATKTAIFNIKVPHRLTHTLHGYNTFMLWPMSDATDLGVSAARRLEARQELLKAALLGPLPADELGVFLDVVHPYQVCHRDRPIAVLVQLGVGLHYEGFTVVRHWRLK